MNLSEIILIVFMLLMASLYVIYIVILGLKVKMLENRIGFIEGKYDILMDFSLKQILKIAVDDEDYETAVKCNELLKGIEPDKASSK